MRKLATPAILVLALLLVVGGVGAAVIWQRIHDPYKGFTESEQFIEVAPGTGTVPGETITIGGPHPTCRGSSTEPYPEGNVMAKQ